MANALEILEDLNKHGIDFDIRSLQKGKYFKVRLLNADNERFLCGSSAHKTIHSAVTFLMESAFFYYPDSDFTKKYKRT